MQVFGNSCSSSRQLDELADLLALEGPWTVHSVPRQLPTRTQTARHSRPRLAGRGTVPPRSRSMTSASFAAYGPKRFMSTPGVDVPGHLRQPQDTMYWRRSSTTKTCKLELGLRRRGWNTGAPQLRDRLGAKIQLDSGSARRSSRGTSAGAAALSSRPSTAFGQGRRTT
jgi:hypothetical protein